jgi:nicotinamide-nucleotide amidase
VAADAVHLRLFQLGATVSTAESLTGGRLAALLTATPGASETYVGGFVTYATRLKSSELGVPEGLIAEFGVVSAECAAAMAEGARAVTGSTYGVSTTGVAGPGPQDGLPAGLVFVGLAGPEGVRAVELNLHGSRNQVQDLASLHALSELDALLLREDMGLE